MHDAGQPDIQPLALDHARAETFSLRTFVRRAVSSVVEHYVDIVGVTSSNLVPPTIFIIGIIN